MKSVEDNEYLNKLCKEFDAELTDNLKTRKIYYEIANFKYAENIYCMAYEMLIRTDEYNTLLASYDLFINSSSSEITDMEFIRLNVLIGKMNKLGLKKTSFLGFDCDNDSDNVFKRIKQYEEIVNSPWNVRMLHKFELQSKDDNLFYLVLKFYNDKEMLYINKNNEITKHVIDKKSIDKIKKLSKFKNKEELHEFNNILKKFYILCINKETNKTSYKILSGENIYLKELDSEFLLTLKEKTKNDLLIQTKSEYSSDTQFWYKYSINDIKDGLNKLIEFHVENSIIYNQNSEKTDDSYENIRNNISDYYIPCVGRINSTMNHDIDKDKKINTNLIKVFYYN